MKPLLSLGMTVKDGSTRSVDEVFSFLTDMSAYDLSKLEILLILSSASEEFLNDASEYLTKREINFTAYQSAYRGVGSKIHASIREAEGEWYMLLSGDDTLNGKVFSQLLNNLSTQILSDSVGIVAYNVQESELNAEWQTMPLEKIFPMSFTVYEWSDLKHFKRSRLFTLNNSVFRSNLLKKSPLRVPDGTDLAEYVYSYLPLPYIRHLYYADYNLRLSVNSGQNNSIQSGIVDRTDDLLQITHMLFDVYRLEDDVRGESKRDYMYTYLSAIVSSCALALLSMEEEPYFDDLECLWAWMKRVDLKMYRKLRSNTLYLLNLMSNDRWRILRRQGIKISKRYLTIKP